MATITKKQQQEKQEAAARLREIVNEGDTIYTILKHAARSGMQRTIQLVAIKDNQPLYLGFNAAIVIGATYDRQNEGVKVGGVGMDMGFWLVYNLSQALFDDGYKLNHRWL